MKCLHRFFDLSRPHPFFAIRSKPSGIDTKSPVNAGLFASLFDIHNSPRFHKTSGHSTEIVRNTSRCSCCWPVGVTELLPARTLQVQHIWFLSRDYLMVTVCLVPKRQLHHNGPTQTFQQESAAWMARLVTPSRRFAAERRAPHRRRAHPRRLQDHSTTEGSSRIGRSCQSNVRGASPSAP